MGPIKWNLFMSRAAQPKSSVRAVKRTDVNVPASAKFSANSLPSLENLLSETASVWVAALLLIGVLLAFPYQSPVLDIWDVGPRLYLFQGASEWHWTQVVSDVGVCCELCPVVLRTTKVWQYFTNLRVKVHLTVIFDLLMNNLQVE